MKKLIMTAAITVCMALCAAVWPPTAVVVETPLPVLTSAVTAPEAPAARIKLEAEIDPPAEKETDEPQQPEPLHESIKEPDPEPVEAPAVPEVQPTPEPEPAPEPTSAQTVANLQPGDMVYVEGFGWLEYQGPNHCEYGADIYENGNKIGIMG